MKLLRQIAKYGKAWMIWQLNGKPVRDEKLIIHLFQTACKPCLHYDPDLKECSMCECPVSENIDERNKLLYATESCPAKPPRFTAEVDLGGIGDQSGEGMDCSTEAAQREESENSGDRRQSPHTPPEVQGD